jgi:rod shape-determining protein MreB and related proteins
MADPWRWALKQNECWGVRPGTSNLKDGVIADFEICEKMLRYFIQQIHTSKWSKPRMVICVPAGITGVEQRAVQDAAEYAGARKPVHIIEEPMAAAIGSGIAVHEPAGNMIVDIGGGTTEVAVISLGGIVVSQSLRVAGDELTEAIGAYVKREFSLDLGENTCEEIKIQMGSAWKLEEEFTADIGGRDSISGLPRRIELTTEHIREALEEPLTAIIDAIKSTIDKTPPELAADIMENGIMLSGGGALLAGIAQRVSHETGMRAVVAADPLYSVVFGSGQALENIDAMRGLLTQTGID